MVNWELFIRVSSALDPCCQCGQQFFFKFFVCLFSKDLLFIFTPIANSEEAARAEPQASSLISAPEFEDHGMSDFSVLWEIPEMQRLFFSPIFSGSWITTVPRILVSTAAFSAQGTNTVVGVDSQGRSHSWQAPADPVHLPTPGPSLLLSLLVPHWADPGLVDIYALDVCP